MPVYLSIFLDQYGEIRETLEKFNSISELDNYTSQFVNSDEVRKIHIDKISEFLLDYQQEVVKRETKYGNQRGRITAYYEYKDKKQIIKIAYKDKPVTRRYNELNSLKEQLKFIKELYNDVTKIFEKYNYIRIAGKIRICAYYYAKFGYLLSEDEIYSLRLYYKNNNVKYLDDFFNKIKWRLKKNYQNQPIKSMMLSQEELENIEQELGQDVNNGDSIRDGCTDQLFIELYKNKKYEEMYNLYDLDEIDKNIVLVKK